MPNGITIRQLDAQIDMLGEYYEAAAALCCAFDADSALLEAVKEATKDNVIEFRMNGISGALLRQQTFLKELRDQTEIHPTASVDMLSKLMPK